MFHLLFWHLHRLVATFLLADWFARGFGNSVAFGDRLTFLHRNLPALLRIPSCVALRLIKHCARLIFRAFRWVLGLALFIVYVHALPIKREHKGSFDVPAVAPSVVVYNSKAREILNENNNNLPDRFGFHDRFIILYALLAFSLFDFHRFLMRNLAAFAM